MESPFLNRREEIEVDRAGRLPHWEQFGKLQFVTFRLNDSMPQSVVNDMLVRKKSFELNHPKPWDEATALRYHSIDRVYGDRILAQGYGRCELRSAEVRRIVEEAIAFQSPARYEVAAYVIMPNHVHMLIRMNQAESLQKAIGDLKSFTAHRINKLLNRRGPLWQAEYHDRIVRSEAHFENCVAYIVRNPKGLPPSDFTIFVNRAFEV